MGNILFKKIIIRKSKEQSQPCSVSCTKMQTHRCVSMVMFGGTFSSLVRQCVFQILPFWAHLGKDDVLKREIGPKLSMDKIFLMTDEPLPKPLSNTQWLMPLDLDPCPHPHRWLLDSPTPSHPHPRLHLSVSQTTYGSSLAWNPQFHKAVERRGSMEGGNEHLTWSGFHRHDLKCCVRIFSA